MTFTSFAVDYKLPQNRLQLTFILLLTTVTFKFVVNQSLPRISYLTYLVRSSNYIYMQIVISIRSIVAIITIFTVVIITMSIVVNSSIFIFFRFPYLSHLEFSTRNWSVIPIGTHSLTQLILCLPTLGLSDTQNSYSVSLLWQPDLNFSLRTIL